MIRILKFPAQLPSTAIRSCRRVLSVQLQHGEPMIWAEIDEFLSSSATVRAYATGEQMEDVADRYVGTVVGIGGHLVFHFYAGGERLDLVEA